VAAFAVDCQEWRRWRDGKIYQLNDTQFSDDGVAISSYYTTHFFPERA